MSAARRRRKHARRRGPPGVGTLVALIAGALVVVLAAGAAVWWFLWVPNSRPELAVGQAYGIDVTHDQGLVDWEAVAGDGIKFAYIKATEGTDVSDARFAENWSGAAAARLRRGAYHFFSLCSSGADQAVYFLGTAPPVGGALPPAVDLELAGNCQKRPDNATVLREVQAFLTAIDTAWRTQAVIYVGPDWESRYPILDRVDRPHWLRSFFGPPKQRWSIWQVHGSARVDGVDGRVDLDVGRLGDLGTVPTPRAG